MDFDLTEKEPDSPNNNANTPRYYKQDLSSFILAWGIGISTVSVGLVFFFGLASQAFDDVMGVLILLAFIILCALSIFILYQLNKNYPTYKIILKNLPADIAYLDSSGKVIFANDKGVSKKSASKSNGTNFDFNSKLPRSFILKVLRSTKVYKLSEYLGPLKAGQAPDNRYYDITLIPLADGNGKTNGLIAHAAEVTQRVNQKHELENVHATLLSLLRGLADGVALFNADYQVVYWNDRLAQITGMTLSDVQRLNGIEILKRIKPLVADPEETLLQAQKAFTSLESSPAFDMRLPGPPIHDLRVRLFPVRDKDERLIGTGMLVSDVTNEKEVDRMKSEFVGLASHELRTPVTTIAGFSELLLYRTISEEKQSKYIEQIYHQSQRIQNIIEHFLDLSRIESGKVQLELKPTSALDLVNTCIDLVKARGILTDLHSFNISIPDKVPEILADSARFTQILENLLTNAIKYSPDGGEIKIIVNNDPAFPDHLVFSVSDKGLGMSESDQARLFTPFYRVGSHRERGIQGTGLGLSIVKQLIDLHGGRIWVQSTYGRGTTFFFTMQIFKDTGTSNTRKPKLQLLESSVKLPTTKKRKQAVR